ncbi:MAG: hypothetical protein LBT89_09720, partial [Planctomycetaceae bacterium]|nr:hypothetical protein [Planctomycetaceae bacterium]
IHQERLLQKANCSLPMFLDETKLRPLTYPKPVSVPSRTAVSQNGLATVVVCGGIEINPFPVLQKVRLESKMDKDRNRLIKMTGSSWREN